MHRADVDIIHCDDSTIGRVAPPMIAPHYDVMDSYAAWASMQVAALAWTSYPFEEALP